MRQRRRAFSLFNIDYPLWRNSPSFGQKRGTDLGVFATNHKLTVTLDEKTKPLFLARTDYRAASRLWPVPDLKGPVRDLDTKVT